MRVSAASRPLATSAYRMNRAVRTSRVARADVRAQLAELAESGDCFMPIWETPVPATAMSLDDPWTLEEAYYMDSEHNLRRDLGPDYAHILWMQDMDEKAMEEEWYWQEQEQLEQEIGMEFPYMYAEDFVH